MHDLHLLPVGHQGFDRLLHSRMQDDASASECQLHAVVLVALVHRKVVGDGRALLIRQLTGAETISWQ